MATTPMIFAFGTWLEAKAVELQLPSVLMDDLEENGECLCLSQTSSIATEKEYINGSRVCKLEVDIIAQGSIEDKENLITYLTKLVYLFEEIHDYNIDNEHRILRCSSTAPAIRSRSENDMLKYAIAVSVIYKEF